MQMLSYVAFEQPKGLLALVDSVARRYSVSLRAQQDVPGSEFKEILYLIEPEPIHVEVFVDDQQAKPDDEFRYRDGKLYWLGETLEEGTTVRVRCYAKKD